MDGVQLPQGYSFYRPRKDERLSRPWSLRMTKFDNVHLSKQGETSFLKHE